MEYEILRCYAALAKCCNHNIRSYKDNCTHFTSSQTLCPKHMFRLLSHTCLSIPRTLSPNVQSKVCMPLPSLPSPCNTPVLYHTVPLDSMHPQIKEKNVTTRWYAVSVTFAVSYGDSIVWLRYSRTNKLGYRPTKTRHSTTTTTTTTTTTKKHHHNQQQLLISLRF